MGFPIDIVSVLFKVVDSQVFELSYAISGAHTVTSRGGFQYSALVFSQNKQASQGQKKRKQQTAPSLAFIIQSWLQCSVHQQQSSQKSQTGF